ncbi:hypothetical protein MESS2_310006 [Mesorhizobium metallidurans STM 2683]|uniref:Uncharacterized protein n=1 Tax=Mesorhizobium metallidurans STM 2683 TaxID=1297569 RepID=M5F3G8_9HYPH|nr:hypothetical protein MESS2_310006 [Mesorhizobium metallidurans STM 2683]
MRRSRGLMGVCLSEDTWNYVIFNRRIVQDYVHDCHWRRRHHRRLFHRHCLRLVGSDIPEHRGVSFVFTDKYRVDREHGADDFWSAHRLLCHCRAAGHCSHRTQLPPKARIVASQCWALIELGFAALRIRLLNLVLSNCEWNRGEVGTVFRQPFDLLAETAASAAAAQARGDVSLTRHPIWLGNLDSNQD